MECAYTSEQAASKLPLKGSIVFPEIFLNNLQKTFFLQEIYLHRLIYKRIPRPILAAFVLDFSE
jgi:hypothetical protein